jgi:hypothetical protein
MANILEILKVIKELMEMDETAEAISEMPDDPIAEKMEKSNVGKSQTVHSYPESPLSYRGWMG